MRYVAQDVRTTLELATACESLWRASLGRPQRQDALDAVARGMAGGVGSSGTAAAGYFLDDRPVVAGEVHGVDGVRNRDGLDASCGEVGLFQKPPSRRARAGLTFGTAIREWHKERGVLGKGTVFDNPLGVNTMVGRRVGRTPRAHGYPNSEGEPCITDDTPGGTL